MSTQAVKLPDIIAKRQKIGDTVVLGTIAAGAVYAATIIMPYVLSLLGMIQTGIFRLVAIGAGLVVLYVGGAMLPTLIRGLKVLSRYLTNQLVAIDPIGFMKEMMSKLAERMEDIREKVGALRASIKEIENEEKELEHAIADIKVKAQVAETERQITYLGRDLQRKQTSLANVQGQLVRLRRYDQGLKEAREIIEIKQQDLGSELEEAERNWRLVKATKGLAEDMRAFFSPTDGDVEWGTALLQVDSSLNETFASLDLLMEDMSATMANRKLDDSVAALKISELRQQAAPVRARIEDPALSQVATYPILNEDSVPRINLNDISSKARSSKAGG